MSEPDKKEDPPKAEPAKELVKPALMEAPLLSATSRVTAILKPMMALSAGGGAFIALLYFLRIGYLPVESLSSFAALSGAIVLVSVGLFIAVIGLWGFPALLCWAARQPEARDFWFSWFEKPRPQPRNGLHVYVGRTFVAVISTIGATWLLLIGLPIVEELFGAGWWITAAWWTILTAALANITWHSTGGYRQFLREWRSIGWQAVWASAKKFSGAVYYGFSGTLSLLVFIELLQMSQYRSSASSVSIAVVFATAFIAVIFFNMVMLAIASNAAVEQKAFVAVFVVFTTCLLLIGVYALRATARVHDAVMATVSVRVNRAHLVLSKDACNSLSQLGVLTAPVLSGEGKRLDTCVLPDVTVLSRLGDRWRISCDPQEGAAAVPRLSGDDSGIGPAKETEETTSSAAFMLDAKSVVSWYQLDPRTASPRYGRRAICGDWGITPAAGEPTGSNPSSATPPAATASGAKP